MITFLKTLLLLSAAGTVCGTILILLRKLSKGIIPGSFLYFAWIVVVLRFAVPLSGLIPVSYAAAGADVSGLAYTEPLPVYTERETAAAPSSEDPHTDTPVRPLPEPSAPPPSASAETPTVKKTISVPTVLFVVWCCGTAGFLLWNVISYFRFASALRTSLSAPSRKDLFLYDEVCPSRKPALKRSGTVSAPLTYGIVNPVLVIPDTEYKDPALKCIFSHEIIHFKRRDVLLKWLFLLVFSAHWFNPFVRYFRKEIDRVCELSCDEILLRRMDPEEKQSYGETLLTIAENACGAPYRMITGFSEGKKDLKERLLQIMSFKKKSKIAIAIALVPVLILCGCAVALGPKADKAPGTNTVSVSDVDELLDAIAPNTVIHMEPGTYDLTKAANYGKKDPSKYYHWNNYGFDRQYELCIEEVDDLRIVGDDAEILTVPRSSHVLAFKDCARLSLQGLTVGHTEAVNKCEGGVIKLDACDDAVIDNCCLYGCGTVGVIAEGSRGLHVANTDIYHCTTAGINFSDAAGLSVSECRIYDCGQPGKYQAAAGAFLFYNASDISLRNCDIHDNHLQTLIQGNVKAASFEGLRIRDNHISSVFFFDGHAQFSDVSFTGNTIDKWTDEHRTAKIAIDGKNVTEEKLTAMWGEQMSSAGIGEADAEYLSIDRTGTKEVHVKTADEFTAAIASDTTVYIDVPRIDLTECSDYGKGAAEVTRTSELADKVYAWADCADGYELCIGNVRNFHIAGGEIVTQPRYANVLNFTSCTDVTLENVCLGHTPEQGSCMGGVLFLKNSDNIILEGCDLYGCGILGITAGNVRGLHVQNTRIHDCSSGAAMLEDTENAVFLGCSVVNCPYPHFFLNACSDFSWDRKIMDPYSSFDVN